MTKFYLIIASILFSCSIWTQKPYMLERSLLESAEKVSLNTYQETQGEIILSWLEDEEFYTNLGGRHPEGGTTVAFIEFYPEDLLFDDITKTRPESIKSIQFYLSTNYFSIIDSCRVIIMQGEDIHSASEVVSQDVSVVDLRPAWNTVDLSIPYNIDDYEKNLYIGYEVNYSQLASPIGAAKGSNPKQGWFNLVGLTGYLNGVEEGGFVMLIKAIASGGELFDNEIELSSLDTEEYALLGESIELQSTLKNIGKNPVTSFKVEYEIDGTTYPVEQITGINVATGETYSFKRSQPFVLEESKFYPYNVTITEANAITDFIGKKSLTGKIVPLTEKEQRIVLHEGFSSSTCGPSYAGNVALKRVLDQADPDKYVSIKYQMDFPGTGDPYYTAEVGARATFYSIYSRNGIPQLNVDGLAYADHPSYYTLNMLDKYADIPAFVKFTATAEVEKRIVNLSLMYEPLLEGIDLTYLRFFAAIIEKTTTKNAKTNGETVFYNVFKKFITSPYGDELEKWKLGEAVSIPYTYTFQGDYRLPGNANYPVDHETEHSVENFGNLEVVYWIQDINTYEVYQAGKADAVALGISNKVLNENNIKIFPNPVKDIFTVQSNTNLIKIEVIDVTGRTVKEVSASTAEQQVNIEDLPTGLYIIRIDNEEGIFTQKIQRH